jgi:hypothetical protein
MCAEGIMARNYDTKRDTIVVRCHMLLYLTEVLDWTDRDCPQCFDRWRESTKDPLEILGDKNVQALAGHMQ